MRLAACLLGLTGAITACTAQGPSAPTTQPPPIESPAPTATPTISHPTGCKPIVPSQPWVCVYDPSTPTPRPSPTETPRVSPTLTSTLTDTPTASPAQTPLLIYGVFGGDGGSASDFYLGRDTPRLAIYANGDLIRRRCTDYHDCEFIQSHLAPSTICKLWSSLDATGFFDVPLGNGSGEQNPIYHFDETTQFSDGASSIVIQVNGDPSRHIDIYGPYYRYAIPPLRNAARLLADYLGPAGAPYRPTALLLWIEEGRGLAAEGEIAIEWPEHLPPLRELWKERVQDVGFFGGSHVVLTSDNALAVYASMGERMKGMLVEQAGELFFLIPRPLLPHETPQDFSPYPYASQSFPFPFACGE